MLGDYGGIMDFIACCLFVGCLLIPTRRTLTKCGACLVALGFLSILFSFGWILLAQALFESLSTINQTVGGVLFGAVVLLVAAVVEKIRDKKNKMVQKLIQVAGLSVFIAIGAWFLIFIFELFVSVPIEINREANRITIPKARTPIVHANWDRKTPEVGSGKIGLELGFVGSAKPNLVISNPSSSIAHSLYWRVVVWDINTQDVNPLQLPADKAEWMKPHTQTPPMDIFDINGVASRIQTGDKLVGSAVIDCVDCVGETYAIYIVWGSGGWYAKRPYGGKLMVPRFGSRQAIQAFAKIFDSVPTNKRIPIQ